MEHLIAFEMKPIVTFANDAQDIIGNYEFQLEYDNILKDNDNDESIDEPHTL